MKPISKQLGQDALFKAIVHDFAYPGTDLLGEKKWQLSTYPFAALFNKLHAEEALFDAIRKFKGVTYVLDKTLSAINIRQFTPAGQLFYDWIKFAGTLLPSDKYELSPESMLLDGVAHQLGLTPARFSQNPDPSANVIGVAMPVLQGELIDAFGCRAFEMMQRASFKELSKTSLKEIQSATSKTERYFGRLENNHSTIRIRRFELHYRPEVFANVDIRQNAQHLDHTIAKLLDQSASSDLIGYWWKRRYLPEHGLGIHLILLSEERAGQAVDLISQQVSATWAEFTKNQGTIAELTHYDDEGNHRCWGAKRVNIAHTGISPLQSTLNSIRLMLESDKYLRLKPVANIAHWGMGELPAPVIRTDAAWQSATQTRSLFDQAAEALPAHSTPASAEAWTNATQPQ